MKVQDSNGVRWTIDIKDTDSFQIEPMPFAIAVHGAIAHVEGHSHHVYEPPPAPIVIPQQVGDRSISEREAISEAYTRVMMFAAAHAADVRTLEKQNGGAWWLLLLFFGASRKKAKKNDRR